MSIPVDLDDLADEAAARPIAYLLTAGDDGPPHCSEARLDWSENRVVTGAGRTTVRHVASRSTVSILWPPVDPEGYTLIADGNAEIIGEGSEAKVVISPTWAVLHKAPSAD